MNFFRFTPLLVLNASGLLGQAASPSSAPPLADVTPLDPVTVTGTREKALLSETPASIGAISPDTIHENAPLHPGQLLGQIPGVAIAVTNGEGHTTAIRQPFTTSPVYLFLEDGIPVHATGFFNHNALYEINLPMAGGIEVVRGPATALYGSDAIGGVINVLSRAPIPQWHGTIVGELGAFGTRRGMLEGGGALAESGSLEAGLNRTHTDGWREKTAYDRTSVNLRVDQPIGSSATLKSVVGFSRIDQQTGANSPLTLGDYLENPTRNLMPIAYRKVNATRISVEYEQSLGTGMVSLIPYFRDNAMELNGTFNLNSDPRIERTHNVSYGLLAKWRKNFAPARTRVIAGVDLDHSPGSRAEDNLLVTRTGSGANTFFSSYVRGARIYDYQVTFESVSPYVHTEFSPLAPLRITAGLRYDSLRFNLRNHLPAGVVPATVLGTTRYYGQLADDERRFSRLTPKFGATYALAPHAHLYGSYNFGFRAPSESQLYRAGNDASPEGAIAKAQLLTRLKPIKASQAELGLRGNLARWSYQLVVYDLTKRDDLVSQRDLATNLSVNTNAGKTEHRGVELGIGVPLVPHLRVDTALSYSRQRYASWISTTANFSGKEIEAAPRVLANTRLSWRPDPSTLLQVEWIRIGSYWLEASNSPTFGKYPGHDLLNVRASWALTKHLELFARVLNTTNRRFADSASVTSNTAVYSPGLPRALYVGVEAKW